MLPRDMYVYIYTYYIYIYAHWRTGLTDNSQAEDVTESFGGSVDLCASGAGFLNNSRVACHYLYHQKSHPQKHINH